MCYCFSHTSAWTLQTLSWRSNMTTVTSSSNRCANNRLWSTWASIHNSVHSTICCMVAYFMSIKVVGTHDRLWSLWRYHPWWWTSATLLLLKYVVGRAIDIDIDTNYACEARDWLPGVLSSHHTVWVKKYLLKLFAILSFRLSIFL